MSAARRHRAPIRRLHADGTECAHRIAPAGRPREGQDCSGVASYAAACACGWSAVAAIRAVVEEKARGHRASWSGGRADGGVPAGAPSAQIRAALHGAQPADARDLFDRVRAVDPALARRVAHELAGGERP